MSTLLSTAALLLVGCGDGHKSSAPAPITKAPPLVQNNLDRLNLISHTTNPRLLGSWETACGENTDGSSSRATLEFKDDHVIEKVEIFFYSKCQTKAFDVRFVASYEATADHLALTWKQFHIMIHNDRLLQAANQAESCGFNGWTSSTWFDVTDITCKRSSTGIWLETTASDSVLEMTLALSGEGSNEALKLGTDVLHRTKL